MKRDNHSDFEKDPVWELLRESAAKRPSPNFASNVVRAARLESQAKPWWKTFLIPLSAGTALAGAAALVAVVMNMQSAAPQGGGGQDKFAHHEVTTAPGSLDDLQDTVETEVFLTACENLGAYKDEELVSMIGF